jgi:hypothetical protein
MSMYEEVGPDELVAIYQRAHEELAELEGRILSAADQSLEARETRAAIDRHRVMIGVIRNALRASH